MRTVLITGSSKGLGKSLAFAFAQDGYNVILHGRDERELKVVARRISETHADHETVMGDITSEDTIDKLYVAAGRKDIDILINNAGVYANKPFQDMDFKEFERILDVNLMAPIRLIKRIYPIFAKKKSGLIININSMAGKIPNEMEVAYCASKYGLRGFSDSFQVEANRDNVRLISVYLGAMRTAMTKDRSDHQKLIQPHEVADFILALCRNYLSLRVTEINLYRKIY